MKNPSNSCCIEVSYPEALKPFKVVIGDLTLLSPCMLPKLVRKLCTTADLHVLISVTEI